MDELEFKVRILTLRHVELDLLKKENEGYNIPELVYKILKVVEDRYTEDYKNSNLIK